MECFRRAGAVVLKGAWDEGSIQHGGHWCRGKQSQGILGSRKVSQVRTRGD